jgi:C1A family cysteine protease
MHRSVIIGLVLGSGLIWAAPAWAQLTAADIDALQAQGEREGWTFTVGESDATRRPLSELCGFVAPDNWWVGARFDPCVATRALPAAYDWRNVNGQNFCPPVRNQASCGSCWAFGTIGPLECNIMIHDGDTPDLSEQWLVSCNSDGWDCGGGFWAHDYLEWKTDPCGGTGAVAEASFPYVALDVPCNARMSTFT